MNYGRKAIAKRRKSLTSSTSMLGKRANVSLMRLFFILIMAGLFSFLLKIPSAYGIILILFSFCGLTYMPRVVLMEFYQDYMVAYNRADKSNCVLIYYEDVFSWHYHRGTQHDYLYIELEDGRSERIEGFSRTIFESNMNRFLKDKNRKNLQ